MPMPKDLTTNLIEVAPDDWAGCDHLDCLPECWPSEYHCERLAIFMRERGILRQPYTKEVEDERRECDVPGQWEQSPRPDEEEPSGDDERSQTAVTSA